MLRKIVKIDEEKCNGCGECIVDCPEGALQIVDGKARLVKESYCDGLGVCIGKCPLGAITIEEREADAFNEEAVRKHMAEAGKQVPALASAGGGCPGSAVRQMRPPPTACPGSGMRQMRPAVEGGDATDGVPSQLSHWPVQLTLVPPNAPFLQDADLLLVADCVPFALADFHSRFLSGHPLVVGCPKLDNPEAYVRKLRAMFEQSSIKSLTILHMEVPCCTGLCRIVKTAMEAAGGNVPVKEVTVSIDGRVIGEGQW